MSLRLQYLKSVDRIKRLFSACYWRYSFSSAKIWLRYKIFYLQSDKLTKNRFRKFDEFKEERKLLKKERRKEYSKQYSQTYWDLIEENDKGDIFPADINRTRKVING